MCVFLVVAVEHPARVVLSAPVRAYDLQPLLGRERIGLEAADEVAVKAALDAVVPDDLATHGDNGLQVPPPVVTRGLAGHPYAADFAGPIVPLGTAGAR